MKYSFISLNDIGTCSWPPWFNFISYFPRFSQGGGEGVVYGMLADHVEH